MAKKRAKPPPEPRKCKHESFVIEEIHRSAIKSHPFNPRRISEANRDKLRKNLKKIGLTHPLTWNKRTGHLIAGHQRIGILDGLERTDNYTLNVAVVDLDQATEDAQLIAENNLGLQGEFDKDLLEKFIKEEHLDLDAAGLDVGEMVEVFGEDILGGQSDKLEAMSAALEEAKEGYEKMKSAQHKKDVPDFYVVLVFRDAERCSWLSELLGQPGVTFIDGELLRQKVEGNGRRE